MPWPCVGPACPEAGVADQPFFDNNTLMTAPLTASPVSVHGNQFHSKAPCLKLQQSALGGSLLCRPANKLVFMCHPLYDCLSTVLVFL